MKIYISVDIEGIGGVVDNEHCYPKGYLYKWACTQMTKEVNAAIEGAIEAGATEFVVNDAHGNQLNIISDLLHEQASLYSGGRKPLGMMAGIDESFDAVMLIGYHARSNTRGVLCHTIAGGLVYNMWINDSLVGESTYNAAIAGLFNVPVVLVSGDNILCDEVRNDLGKNIITVETKQAMSWKSAKCPHPNKVLKRMKEGAKEAIKNIHNCSPHKMTGPYKGTIQFKDPYKAQKAMRYPNLIVEAPDMLSIKSDNLREVLQGLAGMLYINK